MKRKIIVALFLILTMICSLFAFTGCGDKESGEKQVPVYQGMTITNASTATMSLISSSYRSGGIMLLNSNKENNGDNGNHNGHYKGDHADRNDTIDEENPYPDNNANENIEEEIKSSLNVVGSPDTIYCAEPNQDIYINVHIDNPDSFEIMSFTLNGKKYSSYMFEEGSDMETIVLKYNVGDATGIIEYTIDAIKYIDGTEIKDVIIDGNKTVMAGIKTENQVSANISGVDIGTNALAFSANIKDNNALVKFSNGALKAVLYDGFSIIAEKDLKLGDNTVRFDGLQTNTLYQYAVVGYYDNLSGDGFGMNVLYKDAFYTDLMVLFDNITVGQEKVSFSFRWHESCIQQQITALKLYHGGALVTTLEQNTTVVENLLTDNSYKLVAEYDNLGKTESISIEFTTLAKTAPCFALKNENITNESISADYDITDVDGILSSHKIELFKGNKQCIYETVTNEINFTDLDYYSNYTVRFTYKYDLNDGKGEQTGVYDYLFKTLPYIGITECNIANSSAIIEGQTIYIQITLDNPLNMTVSSAVINGQTYSATTASTASKIFVEILYNGQFTGGNTSFSVNLLNASINGENYSLLSSPDVSASVFINGKVKILGTYTTNTDFELIEWGSNGDKVYNVIKLYNPTMYDITSTNENINLIKIDDNTYYYEDTLELCYDSGGGWHYIDSNINYRNEYVHGFVETDLDYSYHYPCYVLESSETKFVSNIQDLSNMHGRYRYQLTNDIDLYGLEWKGIDFSGVFDGNGHTIKNMSFVGSTNQDVGFFSSLNGLVQNLNIESATIIAECTSGVQRNCGILIGTGHATYIRNCTIDETSIINAKNFANTGGICGAASYNTRIENCQNRAKVLSNMPLASAISCASNQNSLVILNCINLGNLSIKTDSYACVIRNSYTLESKSQTNDDEPCTIDQLNSKYFYTDTLGWSEDVWDFSDLDVENGKYPRLKQ